MTKKRSPKHPPRSAPLPGKTDHVAEVPSAVYGTPRSHYIAASDFKAQCLELMDEVRDRHETLVITKYGVPVAKLVPFEEQVGDIVGFMRGTVLAYGDLVSLVDEPWDAGS